MQVSSEASEEAAAEGGSGVAVSGDAGEEQAAVGGAIGGAVNDKDADEGSSYKHRLSNVNFINMGNLQKIKCVVDNQVLRPRFSQL